jgi:hypothetical protein
MTTTWAGPGGLLSETQTIYAPSRKADDADRRTIEPLRTRSVQDEPKWPAWKVSTFVILFCGAFWTGLVWLGSSLFG